MNQPFTSFKDFRQRYPIRPNDEETLLGSGSYGRVFKVEDQLETEWVAVKISEFKGDDTKSLKAEVELAQRIPRQANIARYDACYRLETDTSVSDFAIMKYYPDGNLADLLRHQTLTSNQIADITRGILLGLQHLHRHRIVHRDFKPANILISRDNARRFVPKIADFGLSKLVNADELESSDFDLSDGRGTPSYKAPEQIEGSRVSFNLDLWAFGVILYEMLTGEKPFRSDLRNSSDQAVRREIEKKIMSVELPTRIEQIAEPYQTMIRRCLVRDIHQRVRREEELLDLLDGIPPLLAEAKQEVNAEHYEQAIQLYEQVLTKREHHADAEKELTRCRSLLNAQRITTLLRDADVYIDKQLYEDAKANYAQILQLDPMNSIAAQALVHGLEKQRPKSVTPSKTVVERTDLYLEQTDLYQSAEPIISEPVRQAVAIVEPVDNTVGVTPVRRATPKRTLHEEKQVSQLPPLAMSKQPALWKILVPVVVSLAGAGLYYNYRLGDTQSLDAQKVAASKPVEITTSANNDFKQVGTITVKTTTSNKDLIPPNADALAKRIQVALDKARRAYHQKDYKSVVIFTSSALQLNPTRGDVAALRRLAITAIEKEKSTTSPESTSESELTKSSVAVAEPTEAEKRLSLQKEAQATYDQLIEDGLMAIANGNNKAKAIADFSRARSLAKEHELNTSRADGAYIQFMLKADRMFDREEFDGAKDWYTVVQALKDTPEVRRKIKQSTN